jgi:hypothetical protein
VEEEPNVNKFLKTFVPCQFVYLFDLGLLVFKDVVEGGLLFFS